MMVDSPKLTLSRCIIKLEEDTGETNVPSDTELGLSASCLFMPNETCEKFVELTWEFTQPVNLIDWIGLFHTDQPSHLHYMDFKSYGVCGSRKGSVNWKISSSNIVNNNIDHTSGPNPTTLCFRYYDGLTGVLRASSPPLFVYSDAQITVTSIVCKNMQVSKNLAYYGKLCSGPCQYRTPYSSDGCWHGLNFSFPADRSSEIKLTLKERVHWAASGGRVLGVVNIAMCGLVGTNNQDLAFVLRPSYASNSHDDVLNNNPLHSHITIIVSCKFSPRYRQAIHETLSSLMHRNKTEDQISVDNTTVANSILTKDSPSSTKVPCATIGDKLEERTISVQNSPGQNHTNEFSFPSNRQPTDDGCLKNVVNTNSKEKFGNVLSISKKIEGVSMCSNSLSLSSSNSTSHSTATSPSSLCSSPNQPSCSSSASSTSVHNLPPGWEVRVDKNGRLIYLDHVNKRTTWHAPIILESRSASAAGQEKDNGYVCARQTVVGERKDDDEGDMSTKPLPQIKPEISRKLPSDKTSAQYLNSARLPGIVKFLQRRDFIRLLHRNEKALKLYNESQYLKHIIQRIRHDPAKYKYFEKNRELVEFINFFADESSPLPQGWQTAHYCDDDDQRLFINHRSKCITLFDPRIPVEEIREQRARSAPPTRRRIRVEDGNGNQVWDIVSRAEEIQRLLSERYPDEVVAKICRKLKLISRMGEAALVRFANDVDLVTAISALDEADKTNPSMSEWEEKVNYFHAALHRAGYGQGPGKIRFRLRRSHLMNDAFERFLSIDPIQLRKYHMVVTFDEEDGLDYGGPSRELFFLLSRDLFNPRHGLFEYTNNAYTVQISPISRFVDNYLKWMELCGRVLGLALIHHNFVDAFFTRAFYKFLLGKSYTIEDMASVDREFYSSLLWIRENRITPDLDLYFQVCDEVAGEVTERELLPGGRDIRVTESNKDEYINLLLRWRLEKNVEEQGAALRRGLYSLMDRDYLRVFSEDELEKVISGSVKIDLDDWRANTEYKGGYYEGHIVIGWFWQTIYLMNNAERLKLLQFVTGTSSIPYEGFRALRGSNGLKKFSIEKWGSEDSLPRAHTCFNRLDLPSYQSQDILSAKLKTAICESSCYAIE